jgi:hypothetical protein
MHLPSRRTFASFTLFAALAATAHATDPILYSSNFDDAFETVGWVQVAGSGFAWQSEDGDGCSSSGSLAGTTSAVTQTSQSFWLKWGCFAVTPGDTIFGRMKYRAPSTTARLVLAYFDNSGCTGAPAYDFVAAASASAEWVWASGQSVVPAGRTHAVLYFDGFGTNLTEPASYALDSVEVGTLGGLFEDGFEDPSMCRWVSVP